MQPKEENLRGVSLELAGGVPTILFVAQNQSLRERLSRLFSAAWPQTPRLLFAANVEEACASVERYSASVVFCELRADCDKAADRFVSLLARLEAVPVIAVGEEGESRVWPLAIGLGAQDYISLDELELGDPRRMIRHAVERQALQVRLEEHLGELEIAKTQFQSLITDNADALVIVSHTMIVRYANPAAERLLDRPLTDLLGSRFQFQLDTRTAIEETFTRSDGRVVVLSICYMDTLWEGSRAYIASLRDITERKTAEEALAMAKAKAEGASKMKSQFLANMSHELRTPLNSILGFSELMGMEMHGSMGNERYKGYVENIANAGSHLLDLINDLLDLSKIEAGHLELTEEDFDLSDLIHAVAEVFEPRIDASALALRTVVPPQPVALYADERKIKQILFNLLSNAVKFTPAGGEVQIGYRLSRNGSLVLFVCDNGVGIPPEQIPRALAAFGQVDNAYTRNQDEGTGLGLTLSKRIAELHDGSLEIRSAVAKGTNVLIALPQRRVGTAVSPLRATAD